MAAAPIIVRLGIPIATWLARHEIEHYLEGFIEGPGITELYEGRVAVEWTGELELRQLQVRYSRATTGGVVEDAAVTTHTFMLLDGSDVPSNDWTDDAHYTAVETAFGVFWGSLKGRLAPLMRLDQFRWYADSADIRASGAPNPVRRVTEVDVVATGSAGGTLPPQCACAITEITAVRAEWGRFYFPLTGDAAGITDAQGRVAAGIVDMIMDAAEIFYNSCRAARVVPVVFAPPLPIRPKKAGGELPARTGVIYEVTKVQVDDIVDIIRRRRWDSTLIRDTRTLHALP